MVCPAVQTGNRFLETALAHVDCQAQAIGSYGYGALSDPGSTTSYVLTALLTIFVALFGFRLLFGPRVSGQDFVGDVLRVAIVLTLATSWPAWRVLGYDLLIAGPGEIANSISQAAQLPGTNGHLSSRLQNMDDALAILYERGIGRRGVATGDWFQLGFGRIAFLVGTLGPLALIRLMTGILLAIAPLVAGLMLFDATRSIFVGWAKSLAAAFFAMVFVSIILAAELALIEPWMNSVLQTRVANDSALAAPAELLVITLAFALISFGAVAGAAWLVFNSSNRITSLVQTSINPRNFSVANRTRTDLSSVLIGQRSASPGARAQSISYSLSQSINRETRLAQTRFNTDRDGESSGMSARRLPEQRSRNAQPIVALGSAYRRSSRRMSAAGVRRDGTG